MDFDLSPELEALQQSVRRLAQDKIKPRAREIDTTGDYPADIFEAFRVMPTCSASACPPSSVVPERASWASPSPSRRWPSTPTRPP